VTDDEQDAHERGQSQFAHRAKFPVTFGTS
jgi:hypothetical protein